MTTPPIPDLHIHAFRSLKDVALDACGWVNVIVGGNNSGKTSVLEAVMLLGEPLNPNHWNSVVEFRTGWPLVDLRFGSFNAERLSSLTWLFPQVDGEAHGIGITSTGGIKSVNADCQSIADTPPDTPSVEGSRVIEGPRATARFETTVDKPGLVIDVDVVASAGLEAAGGALQWITWERGRLPKLPRRPAISMSFATPISHRSDGYLASRTSKLLRAKRKGALLSLLRTLDPKVTDILIVEPASAQADSPAPVFGHKPTLHVDYEGIGVVPVRAMGDGIRRAIHLAALIVDVEKGGVLLLDEVEVGMHATVLQDVFAWLCQACIAAGVQLFVTTHSLEAVDALLEGAPDDDVVLYRLGPQGVRRMGGKALRVSREQLGFEVR